MKIIRVPKYKQWAERLLISILIVAGAVALWIYTLKPWLVEYGIRRQQRALFHQLVDSSALVGEAQVGSKKVAVRVQFQKAVFGTGDKEHIGAPVDPTSRSGKDQALHFVVTLSDPPERYRDLATLDSFFEAKSVFGREGQRANCSLEGLRSKVLLKAHTEASPKYRIESAIDIGGLRDLILNPVDSKGLAEFVASIDRERDAMRLVQDAEMLVIKKMCYDLAQAEKYKESFEQVIEGKRLFSWHQGWDEAAIAVLETLGPKLADPQGQVPSLAPLAPQLRILADKQVPVALEVFGRMLLKADGVAKDEIAAIGMLSSAVSAGRESAEIWVGQAYSLGIGVDPDEDRAATILERCVKRNDWRAAYLLGRIYKARGERGQTSYYTNAIPLFETAMQKGHVKSLNDLGMLHFQGFGTPRDVERGVAFFRRGAELGEPSSMMNYANCLEAGIGVEKDPQAAADWKSKAIKSGCLDNSSSSVITPASFPPL
jgi:hypothetical protein